MAEPPFWQALMKSVNFYARFAPSFTRVGYVARGLPFKPVKADYSGQKWLVTGAAPVEFSDHIGTPMREGLLFVHNTLVGAGLRDRVKIGAAGRIISAFDITTALAMGADWTNAARGYMFALGCIQSLSCHTNRCPTGVATQDPGRQRALVVPDKAERVHKFHDRTVAVLADMLAAAGLTHPDDLRPYHLVHRVSPTETRPFDQVHHFLKANDLVDGTCGLPIYASNWARARVESFDPLH
jgi:hypothetical protein